MQPLRYKVSPGESLTKSLTERLRIWIISAERIIVKMSEKEKENRISNSISGEDPREDFLDAEGNPIETEPGVFPALAGTPGYSKKGKKLGRPSKNEVRAKMPGNRGEVGRPKGDAAIINEYKARMLARPDNNKLLEKMYEIAFNDEHKHQAAVLKMITDRVLPVSVFEQDVKKSGGKSGVKITVRTVHGDVSISDGDNGDNGEHDVGDYKDAIDGEYEEFEPVSSDQDSGEKEY